MGRVLWIIHIDPIYVKEGGSILMLLEAWLHEKDSARCCWFENGGMVHEPRTVEGFEKLEKCKQ